MSAAPFSRLQLAAALIEYDNDSTNPRAPYRSAHDSAIFAPLRRMKDVRPQHSSRMSDYMSAPLPTDTASFVGGRSVAHESRRSRASVSALQNMFGQDHVYDDDGGSDIIEEEEELDVDLASWGIDNLLAKDAPTSSRKSIAGRSVATELPNPHPADGNVPVPPTRNVGARRRPANTRTRSMGNFDAMLDELAPTLHRSDTRRASIASPLDLAGMDAPTEPLKPLGNELVADKPVPFPSYPDADPAGRSVSQLAHYRTQSTMSGPVAQDDNPFALRAPSVISRFDPKSHGRAMSTASMGTQMMLDQEDSRSVASRPITARPASTFQLLRPKVLVMPSPLQPINRPTPGSDVRTTEGFEVSIGGTPLPPGAHGARKSAMLSPGDAIPGPDQLFTPNPRLNMTLSQLTFRNNLMVGGQRDPAFVDIDGELSRATEDGEQIEFPAEEVIETETANEKPYRPAGKLYGKSLIDDLETRKAEMRGKQRVFTGDQRPSMMQRGSATRPTTLIDPASLNTRPDMQRMSSFGIQPSSDLRRQSTLKPLLNFESDENVASPQNKGPPNTRSVFGVDLLWERETAKLREIEAQEREEAERQKKKQEEEEARKATKKKKKGKGAAPSVPIPAATEPDLLRVSMAPPVLPDIDKPSAARPPPFANADDDAQSDESAEEARSPTARKPSAETKRWFAGDSDEEEKTPAQPKPVSAVARSRRVVGSQSDSDEDLPLSAAINLAIKRQRSAPRLQVPAATDDSDEDKPLTALLGGRSKPSSFNVDFDQKASHEDEDEDDKPLGLRASRLIPPARAVEDGDDDDKPLALHPEQQRRTQYLTIQQQQQQQQQQMMMQAQMQNSMFFPTPLMGFPPQMMMPSMVPPQIPSPPPMQDTAKFGRVDKWRHDVAVEGDT